MRKIFICIIFCGIVLQLTGCWVAFPVSRMASYLGKALGKKNSVLVTLEGNYLTKIKIRKNYQMK